MHKKHWIWALLAVPAILMVYQFATDAISYGQTIHRSGQWSVALLIVALSVTPLRSVFGATAWIRFLTLHRRAIGVASFGYAILHTIVYLERTWGAGLIVSEGLEPWLGTGWLALLDFAVLALTSNGVSVRVFRERWKTLHRSVYLGAALAFAHWILATFNPGTAYLVLGLILLMEILRLRTWSEVQS